LGLPLPLELKVAFGHAIEKLLLEEGRQMNLFFVSTMEIFVGIKT
jgi:hypothetical protein